MPRRARRCHPDGTAGAHNAPAGRATPPAGTILFLLERELGRAQGYSTSQKPATDRRSGRAERRERWPSVTAVVPTRERPELLERAVASILGQRYDGEIECLLVFDRSEPAPPSIPVPERRLIRAIVNGRNAGPAGARNTGAFEAQGEFLAFCDDDDEWLQDKLRLQVELLRADGRALVAACGLYAAHRDRSVARPGPGRKVTFQDLVRSRIMQLNMSTLIVRREAFHSRIGPFDEAIPGSYGEDYDWLLRAAQVEPIAIVRQPLVRLHFRGEPSTSPPERWETIIAALAYLLQKHPELEMHSRAQARLYGQLALAHAALGRGAEARSWARQCIRVHPLQARAYIALLVSSGLVQLETVLQAVHRLGRGLL